MYHKFKIISNELDSFQSYGLWNSLVAYTHNEELIDIIPAHDGDFFPENPLDFVERIREAIVSNHDIETVFWPITADIDITLKCNDNCSFCYTRLYAKHPLYKDAEMDYYLLKKLIKELAKGGTKCIRFTGGGEPLIHSNIRRILLLPKKYGLLSCIFTNGNTLNEDISNSLVENFDHIRISINAAKNSTRKYLHRSISKVNDLETIFHYIRYMIKRRREIYPLKKKPLIWTTFLLLPENIDEIVESAVLLKDSGVDSISFRGVYHDLYRSYTTEEFNKMKDNLQSVLSLNSPPEFNIFIPKRDIRTLWKFSPTNNYSICFSCHMRTVIEATNQGPMIKLCGIHRGVHGDKVDRPSISLGIIDEYCNFSDIWHSQKTINILSNRPQKCVNPCPTTTSFNLSLINIWKVLENHPDAIFKKCYSENYDRSFFHNNYM